MSFFSIHGLMHLTQSYGPWLVGVVILLEAMGLPLPAESVLIATAVYAGTTHRLSVIWIVIAAASGAILGDNLGFAIGRSLGWRVLRRWGRHIGLNDDRLILGAYLFRCHGGKVVFFGRFVAVLRTLASLLAGANRMSWTWFLPCNAAGGILWSCIYTLGAYWLGKAVERVARPAALGIGVAVAAAVIVGFLMMRRREHELIARAREVMGEPGQAPPNRRA